jgi:hypothetical protein
MIKSGIIYSFTDQRWKYDGTIKKLENRASVPWEFADQVNYPLTLPPPSSQSYIGFDISRKYLFFSKHC